MRNGKDEMPRESDQNTARRLHCCGKGISAYIQSPRLQTAIPMMTWDSIVSQLVAIPPISRHTRLSRGLWLMPAKGDNVPCRLARSHLRQLRSRSARY